MDEIGQLLEEGLALHRAGRLAEAEALYRRILGAVPGHASALHLLGVAALQQGRAQDAEPLIRAAIAAEPGRAAYLNNLGNVLRALERHDEAIDAYRQAVRADADFADAHTNLGAALRRAGALDEAREVLEHASRLQPGNAATWNNLGNVIDSLGQSDDALAAYRRAIDLQPRYAEARYNLGRALFVRREYAESIDELRRAIELQPDYADAYAQLGLALLKQSGGAQESVDSLRKAVALAPESARFRNELGTALYDNKRFEEAASAYRDAAGLDPRYGPPVCNMGVLQLRAGRCEDAIAFFRRALDIDPATGGAHNGIGAALGFLGRFDEAVEEFRSELERYPDDVDAHMNLGMMLLTLGRFSEGWPEYEYRLKKKGFGGASGPKWAGEELGDASLLVWPEQGAGDNIQFIRYLPVVRALHPGARIIYDTPPMLRRLFAPMLAAAGIEVPEQDSEVRIHGYQIPLLSLPFAMGTEAHTIPDEVPYLGVDPIVSAPWRRRLEYVRELKVGLVWAGNPEYSVDRDRSVGFEAVSALLDQPGVAWISLQKGASTQSHSEVMRTGRLIDWMGEVGDFADTAGLIEALDLVVSVDTSVVHLAGAMGKPVWLLNRYNTDWRWMLGRSDSPWYPTLRIFRQPASGDWQSVVAQVRAALGQKLGSSG